MSWQCDGREWVHGYNALGGPLPGTGLPFGRVEPRV